MTYRFHLPKVFPYVIEASHDIIDHWVIAILDYDKEVTPNGSSFAVTSNAHQGNWLLWLSDASITYLMSSDELSAEDRQLLRELKRQEGE